MTARIEPRHEAAACLSMGLHDRYSRYVGLTAATLQTTAQAIADQEAVPVPIVLYCPACHEQHVDRGEWTTRPHHTHLCEHCGNEWRPSERNTVGVVQVGTNPPKVPPEEDGERPTFRRNPSSPRDCLNCHRPEGEHVWRCVGCDEPLVQGADGLPSILHPHHDPGHATLFCHWVELASEEGS